jgi:transducin (beta)-like 1
MVCRAGFFKDLGQPFKEMRRGLIDVRSASFHPNDPVLACGLFHGGVIFLRGSSHTTSFENWDIEPTHYPHERAILFIQWNVSSSLKTKSDAFGF